MKHSSKRLPCRDIWQRKEAAFFCLLSPHSMWSRMPDFFLLSISNALLLGFLSAFSKLISMPMMTIIRDNWTLYETKRLFEFWASIGFPPMQFSAFLTFAGTNIHACSGCMTLLYRERHSPSIFATYAVFKLGSDISISSMQGYLAVRGFYWPLYREVKWGLCRLM